MELWATTLSLVYRPPISEPRLMSVILLRTSTCCGPTEGIGASSSTKYELVLRVSSDVSLFLTSSSITYQQLVRLNFLAQLMWNYHGVGQDTRPTGIDLGFWKIEKCRGRSCACPKHRQLSEHRVTTRVTPTKSEIASKLVSEWKPTMVDFRN